MMRSVVCAYSAVGHACLAEMLELGADVRLVVSHADAPGESIWFDSVAELARSAGIPVILPANVNDAEAVAAITRVEAHFLFSFYFRQMLARQVLGLASEGALNLHGSLLPRYRGRSPVNWVLVNGESETGVTLHYMDEKPDHGDIVAQRRVPICYEDTARSLTLKLADAARKLLRESYPLLVQGLAPRVPQDHRRSSYFGGRRPEDGLIDWHRPAASIRNLIRAVTDPWPGAFGWFRGRKLTIWRAAEAPALDRPAGTLVLQPGGEPRVAAGVGSLVLLDVTWEGSPRGSAAAWARAAAIVSGEHFE